LVKLKAALKDGNELIGRVFFVAPQNLITDDSLASLLSAFSNSSEVEDVVLAVVDHLLSDLDEETSHAIVCVVVPGNGVDHLNTVHESGKGILDGVRGSFIEGLNELLKSGEILDVILGLVESFGDSQFDSLPLGCRKIDLVFPATTTFGLILTCLIEDIEDSAAVLASELLRDASEFSHALAPVLDFVSGAGFLVVLSLGLGLLDGSLDLLGPVIEDALEVVQHLRVQVLGVLDVLYLVVVLAVVLLQDNVALDALQGFL